MPKKAAVRQISSDRTNSRKDDEVFDATYSSPLYSAKLQERLRELDLGQSGEKAALDPHQNSLRKYKDALVHSIEVLAEDRRKTSEVAREQALSNLLRHLATKYDPVIINYDLFTAIIQSFVHSRSETEAITALQLACVSITTVDSSEDPQTDEYFDSINQLRTSLLNHLESEQSPVVKKAIVTSFAILTYFENAGGGGFGIDVPVIKLLELAESISDAKESCVAEAALNGASLLTTLFSSGSASDVAQYWLYSLLPMLDFADINARLATVKFIAVLFETSDSVKLFEGDNGEASEEIIESLESMCQDSVSRTAKKEKKTQNLLVKSVLRTCKFKQSQAQHIALYGNLDGVQELQGTEEISDLVQQYRKSTFGKSLDIPTWASLVVIEHLGWVFGPGLHTHLASNPFVRSLLKREEVHIASATLDLGNEDSEAGHYENKKVHLNDAKKSKELRKMQLQKVEERELLH